jgi:hypothetical protein
MEKAMEEWREARTPLASHESTMKEEVTTTREEVIAAKSQIKDATQCPLAEMQAKTLQESYEAKMEQSATEVSSEMRALAVLRANWEAQAKQEFAALKIQESQMEMRVSAQAYSAGIAAEALSAQTGAHVEADRSFGRAEESASMEAAAQQILQEKVQVEKHLEEESRNLQEQRRLAAQTFELEKTAAEEHLGSELLEMQQAARQRLQREMLQAEAQAAERVAAAAATMAEAAMENNGRSKLRKGATESERQQADDRELQAHVESRMQTLWPVNAMTAASARRRLPELTALAKEKGKGDGKTAPKASPVTVEVDYAIRKRSCYPLKPLGMAVAVWRRRRTCMGKPWVI